MFLAETEAPYFIKYGASVSAWNEISVGNVFTRNRLFWNLSEYNIVWEILLSELKRP